MKVTLTVKSKADDEEEYQMCYCPYCGAEISETECEGELECCTCNTTYMYEESEE
nr:hypothetical protein [uncultured Cellulosilyticum sp.]